MIAKPRRIIAFTEPVPSGGKAVARHGVSPQVLLACAVIENVLRSMVLGNAPGMRPYRAHGGAVQRQKILQELENGSLEFWSDVAGLDWDCVRDRLYEVAREEGLL